MDLSLFFNHFLLLFDYRGLHFPTTTFPHPTHPHLPPSILPSLWLGPFLMSLKNRDDQIFCL